MRVLLIGGNRFMGYFLAWRLLARGDQVTLLNRGTLPDPFGDRVERLKVDRKSPELEKALAGRSFDAVVDFAAFEAEDVRRLVALLGPAVGHYVLISTGQVYLVREGCPLPSKEEDYPGPLMARPTDQRTLAEWTYGVGKRACEDVLDAAWTAQGFPATRVRIPVVNGERDYLRRVEGYLWRLLDGGPLLLPGGGEHRLRHIYSGEVARTLAHLLGRESTYGKAYNLAQDETPTLNELLALLADALGAPLQTLAVDRGELARKGLEATAVSPFSGTWMSFLDPTRAKAELGFSHEQLERYVGKIVASFLAHPPAQPPEGYGRRAEELEWARALVPQHPR
jgi:nucleoside-diphosphate-sugar epimerase